MTDQNPSLLLRVLDWPEVETASITADELTIGFKFGTPHQTVLSRLTNLMCSSSPPTRILLEKEHGHFQLSLFGMEIYEDERWHKGYSEQHGWLVSEDLSLEAAQHCLVSRDNTVVGGAEPSDSYNRGARQAVLDYIEHLREYE